MAEPLFYGGLLSETTVTPKPKIKGWHLAAATFLLLVLLKKFKK